MVSTSGMALSALTAAISTPTLLILYVLAFGTFPVLSSYAPGGRNFPELTKCEHLPFWQGGGMYITGGTVTVTDTNIYSNQAYYVSGPFLELSSDGGPRRKKLP